MDLATLGICLSSAACIVTQSTGGLIIGMLLFLVAAGLTLIFGVLKVINFTHGSFYMLGAYFALTIFQLTGSYTLTILGAGAATAIVARKVRERARIVASAMLEVNPADLEWEPGRWYVRGDPDQGRTLAEIALAAHSDLELPDGVEGHLDASCVYNPPNLTYPCGAYICVVDVDPGTGKVSVRRFIAVDDCGVRINPMIVEGQVHRGLADGIGMALMESIAFDADGNCLGGSFMDYLLPTSVECPSWELGETVTPSPHHPIGAKGVGESATVGSPPAVVNAVIDALRPYGIRHADMPLTPAQVWRAIQGRPLRTDLAIS